MLETELELYRVAGQQGNHYWLEVLEGSDAGMRLSVPKHSTKYNDELQERVTELSVDTVHRFVLKSDTRAPSQWYVANIEPVPLAQT